MYNISSIKTWIQSFLLPIFIFIFSSAMSFADNLQPELTNIPSSNSSNPYITTLETAINEYKKISENSGWPSFPTGDPIRTGAKDTRIPIVRQIITAMGDYHLEEVIDSNTLDKSLTEAVKKFQARHGLDIDGTLGNKTQAALSVPVEFRIAQMQATLERMRKMPDLGERYVLVNIPAFYLKAVDKNNIVLTSRIIVGSPKNATPLFHRPITDVSFNPQWHVPERIAREEFIGKIRSTPDYLEKGNYIVKNHDGDIINASEINWENEAGNNYQFVQRAGDKNALGKVKFNLPDTDNIYLHSTGNPKLFAKAERALSHGCIRVEMAKELAYFVMNGLTGWNEERVARLYDSNISKIMRITPVQVYLTYWTSWVDETTKRPHFSADIYNRDKKRVSEILAENKAPNTNKDNELKVAMQ